MKRQLMSEDKNLCSSIIRAGMAEFSRPCNLVRNTYEALDLGDFTNDVWKEIRMGAINKIHTRYVNSIQNQFRLAGIKQKAVIDAALKESDAIFQVFREAVIKLRATQPVSEPKLLITDIVFKNGRFGVFDTESIMERHCRIYIENETELRAYSLLRTIADKLTEFEGILKASGYRSTLLFKRSPVEELKLFIRTENDKPVVDIESLKSALAFGQSEKEFKESMREHQRAMRETITPTLSVEGIEVTFSEV